MGSRDPISIPATVMSPAAGMYLRESTCLRSTAGSPFWKSVLERVDSVDSSEVEGPVYCLDTLEDDLACIF